MKAAAPPNSAPIPMTPLDQERPAPPAARLDTAAPEEVGAGIPAVVGLGTDDA
jgi:hypothetical protein